MGSFTVRRKVFRLIFGEGTDIEGAEVACSPLSAHGFAELDEMTWVQEGGVPRGAELAELLDEFAVCLASWNLAEEDGSPIPATADGVRTLGLDIMAPILAEWVTASQVHAFRKQAEVDEADRAEAEQERADADLMASLPVEALEGS